MSEFRSLWSHLLPRLLIVVAFVAAIALFYFAGGSHWLSLSQLLTERDALHAWVDTHYVAALLAAAGLYTFVTVLSIPATTVLSLLYGFLFGLWVGGAIAEVTATLGAIALFLIVRYLAGAAVRRQLEKQPQAQKLFAGFERHAFHYLLFVRLVPLFPFWLVNLAAAFTAIRLSQYTLATFLGMLPASFIFANLGLQFAHVQSLRGLVSPGLFGALALLGVLVLVPVAVRHWRLFPHLGV